MPPSPAALVFKKKSDASHLTHEEPTKNQVLGPGHTASPGWDPCCLLASGTGRVTRSCPGLVNISRAEDRESLAPGDIISWQRNIPACLREASPSLPLQQENGFICRWRPRVHHLPQGSRKQKIREKCNHQDACLLWQRQEPGS